MQNEANSTGHADVTMPPTTSASSSGAEAADPSAWVTYQVRLRPDHAARLRAFAAREGASAEALAALWLEEKLDELARSAPGG